MICSKCNAENGDGAKFCFKCGTPLQQNVFPQESDSPFESTDGWGQTPPEPPAPREEYGAPSAMGAADQWGQIPPESPAPREEYGFPGAASTADQWGQTPEPPAPREEYSFPGATGAAGGQWGQTPGPASQTYGVPGNASDGWGQTGPPIPSYDAAALASPKPKRTLLIIIIIAAIAVALVILFFFVKPFQKEPENPMAALYDGVKNLLATEGFDISMKQKATDGDEDSYETRIDISVLFGEDVLSSVFDLSQYTLEDGDVSYFSRSAYTGSYTISGYWSDWSWYDEETEPFDIDDPANYWAEKISSRDLKDRLKDMEEDIYDYYDIKIDFNSLIVDHRIDSEQAIKYANDFLKSSFMEDNMDYILESLDIRRIPDVQEIQIVFEQFFYVKCEEKGFIDQFFTDVTVSGNTYEFTIDMNGMVDFLRAFEDYLEELESDTATLTKLDIQESSVRDMRRALRVANRGLRSNLDYYDDVTLKIHVLLELDKNRVLKTLRVSGSYEDDYDEYSIEYSVDVTEVNGSKIDIAALDEFAEEIADFNRSSTPDIAEPVYPEEEDESYRAGGEQAAIDLVRGGTLSGFPWYTIEEVLLSRADEDGIDWDCFEYGDVYAVSAFGYMEDYSMFFVEFDVYDDGWIELTGFYSDDQYEYDENALAIYAVWYETI